MPRLVIRSSDIHAAGCFTVDDIPKGARVLEYTGERITKAEGDDRYDGRPFTYLFGIGDGGLPQQPSDCDRQQGIQSAPPP